jgi:uncharacterized protein
MGPVSQQCPRELLDGATWGEPGPVELIVTHASWVLRTARDVFKVKRPVNLGFLDFGTLGARRRACEAELLLNQRLAAGVHLAVVPLARDAGGALRRGADGPAAEWAVHMRRLADGDRADLLLERRALGPEAVEHIAVRLAEFHHAAGCDARTAAFGIPMVISANVEENFEQTRASLGQYLDSVESEAVLRFQRGFLAEHAALFAERAESGRVRDGHGDLRLEHIYLPPDAPMAIIDCIEFNERFRFADVASDLAFLAMDLAFHGAAELAELLLARYARASNDFELYAVVDFYQSYRAFVRGKVSALLAGDADAPSAVRARAEAEARRYFLLALAESRPALRPARVIAVGGLIAAGKSTLADALSIALAAPVIDADRSRKALLGVEPLRPLRAAGWQGAYGPQMTERTYAEVFRRAEAALASGRAVILDASFRTAAMRAEARALAQRRGVPFTFVECRVPEAVSRARLRERETHASVSDAREDLYASFAASWEAVHELGAGEHVVVDTQGSSEALVRAVRAHLG